MPATGLAAQPDVGPEAINEPRLAPAGMAAAQPDDIAKKQLDDGGP
jgi:hypothetical protein